MNIPYKSEHLIVFESSLFRTTSTLIIGKEYLLLVDPNWLPNEVDFIYQYAHPYFKNRKCYLLFTHSDYDHIIGAARFPEFTTIGSYHLSINPDQASILTQIRDFDDQYYIKRNYPIEYPNIDLILSKREESRQLGAAEYIFYQAPGHNKDGLICLNKTQGILIMGDYLSNVEFPFVYESFRQYKHTLNIIERIIQSDVVNIYISGHGDISTKSSEMLVRLSSARQYIEELENAAIHDQIFDLDKWLGYYDFPKIHAKFHTANLELMKKEIKHLPN